MTNFISSLNLTRAVWIRILFATVLFIMFSSPVSADHFTDEEERESREELQEALESENMTKQEYQEKLSFLTAGHDNDESVEKTDDRDESGGGLLSVLIALGVPLFIIYKVVTRNRGKASYPKAPHIYAVPNAEQVVSENDSQEPDTNGVIRSDSANPQGFLERVFEKLRDDVRDDVASGIQLFGIKIEMAERRRPEESIRGASFFGRGSLGIIDVSDDLIKWINVVRTKRRDKNGPSRYRIVFGVPDNTIPANHSQLRMRTVRKKSFPLFGQVMDVYWEGTATIKPLMKVFSDDEDIDKLVSDVGDMTIYTHPNKFQGWTVEVASRFIPTERQWATLQKIANYLLSSPRS